MSSFQAVDPTTGEPFGDSFPIATTADIDAACQTANHAFIEGLTVSSRAAWLRAIADEIEGLGDSLLELAGKETALPAARLAGERGRTCGQLRMFAKALDDGVCFPVETEAEEPDRLPVPKPRLVRELLPIGPVAVFGASNFPLAYSVAGGDTASALAAGCPVIVKGHPAHPGTSQLVAIAIERAMAKCGVPDGWFALLHGGAETGAELVRHPLVSGVGFTGSQRAGRALFDIGASRPRPIPVFAEMGSVNPMFLLPGALEDRAESIAEGYAASLILGVGQFCTNPGLVFAVKGPNLERFLARLADTIGSAEAGVMLTAGICSAFETATDAASRTDGVRQVAIGKSGSLGRATAQACVCSIAAYLANPMLKEEVFGPFGLIVEFESPEEFISVVASLEGQLTGSVHASAADDSLARQIVQLLRHKVGRIVCDGFPTGVEVASAMVHGGPYPATTDSRFSAVGVHAIQRWLRPICYQSGAEKLTDAQA